MLTQRSPDVLVIGGGVIGLATAYELLTAGLRVTLIERGTIGRGSASWAGGGILAPLDPADIDSEWAPLLAESLACYRSWCEKIREKSGIDPEWRVSGLEIHQTRDADAWRAWASAHKLGPVSASASEGAGDDLFIAGVAQVRPPRLLRALVGAVRAAGGIVRESAPVRELMIESDRARGVRLDRERIHADRVVLAAGAWSGDLSVEAQVEPVRGQMLLFRTRPGTLSRIVLRDRFYLIPRCDGRIVAGSTLEYAGFDDRATEQGRAAILDAAVRMLPALAEAPIEAHWSGLRPAPVDGVPLIGLSRAVRGLMLNCGHHRLGITLAPASARRIVEVMRAGANRVAL